MTGEAVAGRRRAAKAARRGPIGRYAGGGVLRRWRWAWMALLVGCAFVYGAAYAVYGGFFLLQFIIPIVILTGFAVWALPDTGRAPTTLLTRLLFAFLIVLLCWPDYLAISLPGLPWVTAVRLIGVPLLTVLLICTSVSSRFRAEVAATLGAFPVIWKAIVIFALIGLASIGLSRHVGDSVSKYLIAQMSWTAVFFAAAYVFTRPGRVMLFARILWGIVGLQLFLGVWEYRYSRVPWAGRIPSFLKVEDEAVQRILAGAARAATGIYRVQTKFTTSLGLAEFLGFATPFVLHITVTTRSLWVRLLGIATIPAVFWLIVRTDSRLGAIGFFMTMLIYLFFWGAIRWRRDRDSLFGPAVVISYPAIFCAFIAATFFVGRLRAMVWGTGAQQASTDSREAMYRAGIPMVMRNPIGHGVGEGANTLGFFNGAGVLTIDTYYLAVALEYGVIGFIVYYGMFLAAIWRGGATALRTADREVMYLVPITIALINFVIIKSVFSQQENHALIFGMLGMVVALVARQRGIERAAPAGRVAM